MASDVFVLPVLQTSNDVEGFGIVAVEAASYGLATVAFDVGGVSDAVASEQSGYLVPSGDYRAFADRVWTHCREAAPPVTPEGCRAFAGQFVPERFRRRLLSIVSGAEVGQGR